MVIDDEVRSQIKACIELAEANPIDMPALMERIKDPLKKEHHMAQMTRQTVKIPLAFMVTFSVEDGHPVGRCRHMSMSVQKKDRLPHPIGLWMIAKEFGFWGETIESCDGVWKEDLQGHGTAINIVQRITPI